MAVFCSPLMFSLIASEPMAVLSEAPALFLSAAAPTALVRPPVFILSARKPMAMLKLPVMLLIPPVTLSSAFGPSPVFPPPGHVLGQSCALSGGESANQQSAIASVKKPQRIGERLTDLIRVFIFLFI